MKVFKFPTKTWGIIRFVFLIAGVILITATLLGHILHTSFFYIAAFIGGVMIVFAFTGYCPMAIVLKQLGVPCLLNTSGYEKESK